MSDEWGEIPARLGIDPAAGEALFRIAELRAELLETVRLVVRVGDQVADLCGAVNTLAASALANAPNNEGDNT